MLWGYFWFRVIEKISSDKEKLPGSPAASQGCDAMITYNLAIPLKFFVSDFLLYFTQIALVVAYLCHSRLDIRKFLGIQNKSHTASNIYPGLRCSLDSR